MKRFLKNILAFIGVFVILLLCFTILLMDARDKYLRLPRETNKVFLGNSTVEYGVDDSRISGSVNFAQNGEPVDILYAKLKLLSRNNPQIDTIFVELDDIILYNRDLVSVVSNVIYYDAFDIEDWYNNFKHYNFERMTKFFSHSYDIIKLKPLLFERFNQHELINLGVGGYHKLYRDKLKEDIIRQSKHKDSHIDNIPQSSIYYFSKIVEFCNKNGIKVIFFNTPKHKCVWGGYNPYRKFWSSHFNDIPFLDFTHVVLPDSCYGDASHLNYMGAPVYTDSLKTILYQRDA